MLDIDVKNAKDGLAALRALGLDLDASPVRVRTPSGGWHLFFRHEPRTKNWVGGSGKRPKLPAGLDCKTDGGYVVAPGSYKGDNRYEPIGEPLTRSNAASLPAFPAVLIPPPEAPRDPVEPLTEATEWQREWAAEKLERDVADLAAMEEGDGRNDTLNSLSMWAGGVAAHGFLGEEEASAVLWEAAEASGLHLREFNATFRSGFEAGLRRPIADYPRDEETTADDFDDLLGPPAAPAGLPACDDLLGEPDDLLGTPAAAKQAAPLFERVSDWEGLQIAEREWVAPDWIPHKAVTLLYGDGGDGKSLMALQLAAAVALKRQWLGIDVRDGKVLLLAAEDDRDEVMRRLVGINRGLGVSFRDYGDRLFIRAMSDAPTLLADLHKEKLLVKSKLLRTIEAYIAEYKPTLLILDTLANFYPGNESDRAMVQLFVNFMKGIAYKHKVAIVMLAHPSIAGMQSGTGSSGSTGWSNGVRSRMYLEKITANGKEVDSGQKRLSTKKVNYGKAGNELTIRWTPAGFEVLFKSAGDAASRASDEARECFLALLARFKAQGRTVNASAGPNYAPTVFAGDPDSGFVSKAALKGAMAELFREGVIITRETGKPSRPIRFIALAEMGFAASSGVDEF